MHFQNDLCFFLTIFGKASNNIHGRGVFRALSKTRLQLFVKLVNGFIKTSNRFRKKLLTTCLMSLWKRLFMAGKCALNFNGYFGNYFVVKLDSLKQHKRGNLESCAKDLLQISFLKELRNRIFRTLLRGHGFLWFGFM